MIHGHSFLAYKQTRAEQQLNELAKREETNKGLSSIVSYLEKRLGQIYKMPGVETFKNSQGTGHGFRYFTANGRSFRLNWKSSNMTAITGIESVDVWDGTSRDPNIRIHVDGVSLVKILPSVADLIVRPQVGDFAIVAESALTRGELALMEARAGANPEEVLNDMIDLFVSGQTFSEFKLGQLGRTTALSLWRKILKTHGELFDVERRGAKTLYTAKEGTDENAFNRELILASTVTLTSELGPNGERYTSSEIRGLEQEARRANAIPYEQQLEDMSSLVKAVVRGASNALFVGGRGGTGKTHMVEQALSEIGLTDGAGYFKNTTSASAAGMYRTLYDYRDSIILFDDCDAVFKDQESRNLLKAATDTKRERKIGWAKNAFWIYKGNPEDLDKPQVDDPDAETDDPFGGMLDANDADAADKKYPKYFNFRGRVIFISNLALDQLDPDGALRTRGFVISIDPTNDEIVDFMKKIVGKIQLEDGLNLSEAERDKVLEIVTSGTNKDDMNIRKLVRSLNMAASGIPNWERLVSRYA